MCRAPPSFVSYVSVVGVRRSFLSVVRDVPDG
ncbi:hypothetical protein STRAU_1976 [Streptomyces aurantiacus JA 4570]|uniref:Uncharacterized protein n=1 Tax=Streptomyces aurantiacus JA 4570 TaxID=1286094 RepID=S3ZQ52_9ACTN|nr:hypothetical protein STRAU_1976 [Streptomyces aurantiacus JA 4570]